MAIKIDIPFQSTVTCPASLEKTYDYLSNFEISIPKHFPGLSTFRNVGPQLYEWTFKEFNYKAFQIVIHFTTKASLTPHHTIQLFPTEPIQSSQLSATWHLKPDNSCTRIELKADFSIGVSTPSFLETLVTPFARKEITQLMQQYLDDVAKNIS